MAGSPPSLRICTGDEPAHGATEAVDVVVSAVFEMAEARIGAPFNVAPPPTAAA